MKSRILGLGLVCLMGLVFVQTVRAEIRSAETRVVVAEDEVIDDDLFIGGETVEIRGQVTGDVYAGGGLVKIKGQVGGDVYASGGMVEISGTVGDDVLTAGGQVQINEAQIGDSLTVAGGSVRIDDQTVIGGSLLVAGGQVEAEAPVGRNLLVGGGQVTVNNSVGKNVWLGADEVVLGDRTKIVGDLKYATERELEISQEAVIGGDLIKVELPKHVRKSDLDNAKPLLKGLGWGMRIWSWLGAMVIGLLLIWWRPKWVEDISQHILDKPWESGLWGLLVLVLALPVFLILLVTVIGIPLGFIWLAVLGLLVYFSKIWVGFAVGSWIKQRMKWNLSSFAVMALGLTVWYILRSVPFAGWVWGLASLMAGVGVVMRMGLGKK